jgi:hypothetical protein
MGDDAIAARGRMLGIFRRHDGRRDFAQQLLGTSLRLHQGTLGA